MFDPSVRHLQRYVTHLEATHSSVDSMKNYVSGVVKLYNVMGFEPPDTQHYNYALTLKGITRFKDHVVKRAQPVYPDMLAEMQQFVDTKDIDQVVAWVSLLLGFYCFFRKSNLVPDTTATFDPFKQLCRGNLFKWATCILPACFGRKTYNLGNGSSLYHSCPTLMSGYVRYSGWI